MASLLLRASLFSLLVLAGALAQDLPKKSGPADFDPEPKLMLNDLPDVPILPSGSLDSPYANRPPANVAKLETSLARAKKNAAFRARLWKDGVFSKLEVEQGEMQVVRLTRDLENARLDTVQREVEELRKQPPADDAAKKALADAEARLATALSAAHEATAQWEQAQRAAAEIRVERERKLLALGAGSKSAVKRAEAALQTLTAAPAP
jgi:hypothetical protein